MYTSIDRYLTLTGPKYIVKNQKFRLLEALEKTKNLADRALARCPGADQEKQGRMFNEILQLQTQAAHLRQNVAKLKKKVDDLKQDKEGLEKQVEDLKWDNFTLEEIIKVLEANCDEHHDSAFYLRAELREELDRTKAELDSIKGAQ